MMPLIFGAFSNNQSLLKLQGSLLRLPFLSLIQRPPHIYPGRLYLTDNIELKSEDEGLVHKQSFGNGSNALNSTRNRGYLKEYAHFGKLI
jgi:hypothetical protein